MSGLEWEFNEVLDRTDLRSLLNEVTMSNGRSGGAEKWHCPDPGHGDQHPSVTVSTDSFGRERWRCWSGDHRGDAIDLVSVVNRVDALDATRWLAARAGMVADRPLPPKIERKVRVPVPPAELSPSVSRYVSVGEAVLRGPQGEPMRRWLSERGITEATWRANRVGADLGRDIMPRRNGLPSGAGPGVVFPAFDSNGKLTYVQTRYLDVETVGYKYDNPAAYLGANPRLTMIQPDLTADYADNPHLLPRLVVTEGIPDGLIAAQAGFVAAALLGSHAPDASVAVRIAERAETLGAQVSLAIDADPSGSQAVETLVELLARHGVIPDIVELPTGLDLNDWALTDPGWSRQLVDAVERRPDLADLGSVPEPVIEREGLGLEM